MEELNRITDESRFNQLSFFDVDSKPVSIFLTPIFRPVVESAKLVRIKAKREA